jgi:amidase
MSTPNLQTDRREFLRLAASTAALAGLLGCREDRPSSSAALTASATSGDLCFTTARDLAALIRSRKVSAREVMTAHLERINQLNPKINAIVAKLDDAQCLALADAADQRIAKRDPVGPLHGLPIAFKDLQPAVGFPFTQARRSSRTACPMRTPFSSSGFETPALSPSARRTCPSSAWLSYL